MMLLALNLFDEARVLIVGMYIGVLLRFFDYRTHMLLPTATLFRDVLQAELRWGLRKFWGRRPRRRVATEAVLLEAVKGGGLGYYWKLRLLKLGLGAWGFLQFSLVFLRSLGDDGWHLELVRLENLALHYRKMLSLPDLEPWGLGWAGINSWLNFSWRQARLISQVNILLSVSTHVLVTAMSRGELFLNFLEGAALFLVSVCSLHEEVLDAIIVDHDKLEAICLFYILRHRTAHPFVYSFLCCSSITHAVKLWPHVADHVLWVSESPLQGIMQKLKVLQQILCYGGPSLPLSMWCKIGDGLISLWVEVRNLSFRRINLTLIC